MKKPAHSVTDAVDTIEKVPGMLDTTTAVGEAWQRVRFELDRLGEREKNLAVAADLLRKANGYFDNCCLPLALALDIRDAMEKIEWE